METKTILCDKCKERVAKDKCEICQGDFCPDCIVNRIVQYGYNEGVFCSLKCCRVCDSLITDLLKVVKKETRENENDEYNFNQLKEYLISFLRNSVIVNELNTNPKGIKNDKIY